MAFIGLRVVYTVLYLANIAPLRSLVWAGALAANIAMFAPTLSKLF
ncbi:MAPEG family protein [Aquabacterium sp.]|nr:MAPEG family protein [Aquabacterium sp.]